MKTKPFSQHLKLGLLGIIMGFVIARIGFANFDEIHNMFIFSDLRMLYAFAGAVMIIMLVFFALSKKIPKQNKIIQPGTIPGSMLFGFGWAVCGACPSIVFVQLGSGKLAAVFTLIGIYIGVLIHRKLHARFFRWDTGSCGS